MKKARWVMISIFIVGLLAGCGEDTEQQDKDRIEQVGDAASTIGYDGEKIKKDLRELDDFKKKQDEKMQEVLDQ